MWFNVCESFLLFLANTGSIIKRLTVCLVHKDGYFKWMRNYQAETHAESTLKVGAHWFSFYLPMFFVCYFSNLETPK